MTGLDAMLAEEGAWRLCTDQPCTAEMSEAGVRFQWQAFHLAMDYCTSLTHVQCVCLGQPKGVVLSLHAEPPETWLAKAGKKVGEICG